jgi:hypothetical protein
MNMIFLLPQMLYKPKYALMHKPGHWFDRFDLRLERLTPSLVGSDLNNSS